MKDLWQAHQQTVNNLSEVIHKIKCKCGHNDKKSKTCGITYEVSNFSIKSRTLKMI